MGTKSLCFFPHMNRADRDFEILKIMAFAGDDKEEDCGRGLETS